MDTTALVSIIIPVYNVEPYLVEALDSVIHQTYTNLEIIIIDDGSTDGSGKICDDYAKKDNRIRIIHQENKGLSTARNIGLNIMTGEFVAFLDPDDAFHLDYVKKLISRIIQHQADLVMCKFTIHNTEKTMEHGVTDFLKPAIQSGIYNRIQMINALFDGYANYAVWNKLFRRELWTYIRFPDGHVHEDREPLFKIINQCIKIIIIDEPLYLHRKRPGSITTTFSYKNVYDLLFSASQVEAYFNEKTHNLFPKDIQKKAKLYQLKILIQVYAIIDEVKKEIDKINKKTEKKKLRQQIIKSVKQNGMDGCSIRFKIAYAIIRFCPWLFRFIYLIQRPFRLLFFKLTGK